MPLDEGDQQVDTVGGLDLRLDLGSEIGLSPRVGQQRGVAQRGRRAGRPHGGRPRTVRPGHAQQLTGWSNHLVRRRREMVQQTVHELNAAVDVPDTAQVRPQDLLEVPGQDGRQVCLVHGPHSHVAIGAFELGAQSRRQELFVDPRLDHPAQLARPSAVLPGGIAAIR